MHSKDKCFKTATFYSIRLVLRQLYPTSSQLNIGKLIVKYSDLEFFSKCPPKCLQDETLTDSIQYGKYQSGKLANPEKMLTSIMIYLKPEHKSFSIEQLEYESTQFFSDVGGAAGLLLGVSFTSLFGMIDFLVSSIFSNLKVNYNRYISFGRKKRERKRDKYCQVFNSF